MNDIQRERNLEQVRNLRQIISGKRSLARAVFDGLLPGQKRLLMSASGIHARTSTIYNSDSQFNYSHLPDFDHLTDSELDDLTKGLRRLQAIIDAFAHCKQQDFIKEQQKVA